MQNVVLVGAGPAGRAAAELLPDAIMVARPEATGWHAEPGRLWIEAASGVTSVAFSRLLLCADEPLLLMALGCGFASGRPLVSEAGETTIPGIYAAGRILGADTPEEAARQGRVAAGAILGMHTGPGIEPDRPVGGQPPPERRPERPPERPARRPAQRLDPLEIAQLLEQPPGPERNRAALAQAGTRGSRLSGVVAPARPVGLAALAAIAPLTLEPRETQHDPGALA